MKRISKIFLPLVLIISMAAISANCRPAISSQNAKTLQADKVPESPLPPPTGFVNDYSNVLDEATEDGLESTLTRLKERSAIEFAIVFIDTTGGQPINDYSMAVAKGWGIGPTDKTKGGGLLLLAAIKDRQWRIEALI